MKKLLYELLLSISEIDNLTDYDSQVKKYVGELCNQGMLELAKDIKDISKVQINKLSNASTHENFMRSKDRLIDYLKSKLQLSQDLDETSTLSIIQLFLNNFYLFQKQLCDTKNIHGKCNKDLKTYLPLIKIENEYDLQQLMYPVLISLFPESRIEKVEDSGHHSIREDIVIQKYDVIIELKCTRMSMTERDLSEEIASDMVHYNSKHIFFYVYDKNNIVKNKQNFINTYETKKIDGKNIHVIIFQPNIIT